MSNKPILEYQLRNSRADDEAFVYKSFLSTLRTDPVHGWPEQHNRIFYTHYHRILEHILTTANISIVCPEADNDTIMGFIIWELIEPTNLIIVHYIHVKGPFRRLGIAQSMFKHVLQDHDGPVVSPWFTTFQGKPEVTQGLHIRTML